MEIPWWHYKRIWHQLKWSGLQDSGLGLSRRLLPWGQSSWGMTLPPPNPIKGMSMVWRCFSSYFIWWRQSMVIRSFLLLVSTRTRRTFIWPILRVATTGSLCGWSGVLNFSSNFIVGQVGCSLSRWGILQRTTHYHVDHTLDGAEMIL